MHLDLVQQRKKTEKNPAETKHKNKRSVLHTDYTINNTEL